MPIYLEAVGFIAGTLTTLCWLPQAIRIIRTRDTRALSIWSQATFTTGCSLWAVYGILAGSLSILVFNAVTATLGLTITGLKLRFG